MSLCAVYKVLFVKQILVTQRQIMSMSLLLMLLWETDVTCIPYNHRDGLMLLVKM